MQREAPPVPVAAIQAFRSDLRVLEREAVRLLQAETACCGVTLAQCHVLLQLARTGSPSLSELAEGLALDKSTLSRTVEGLVKAGLVHRVVDPSDRRAVRLTCTPAGFANVASINESCDRRYAALLSRASEVRRQQIIDTVRFLADGLRGDRIRNDARAGACCGVPQPAAAPGRPGPLTAAKRRRRPSRKGRAA